MAYDFKKEQKQFYLPKNKPEIIYIPPMNYLAVYGTGNPNTEGGDYKKAVSALYTVAYTLKMSVRKNYHIEGFYDYVVPPLEGFWWQEEEETFDFNGNKDAFHWCSVIRVPDFIKEQDVSWAVAEAERKKKADCQSVVFLTMEEGLCAQIMHTGKYDDEEAGIAKLEQYITENGYVCDFTKERRHHEIYLSNPQRVMPSRLRTVIRQPVKRKQG